MAEITLYANQAVTLQPNSGSTPGITGQQISSGYFKKFTGNSDVLNSESTSYIALHSFDKNQMPRGAVILSAQIKFYAWVQQNNPTAQPLECGFRVKALRSGGFSQSSATWANTVANGVDDVAFFYQKNVRPINGYEWITLNMEVFPNPEQAENTKKILQSGFMVLPIVRVFTSTFLYDSGTFHIHTANSANKPQLVVQYNAPTVTVTPNVKTWDTIYRNAGQTVSWSFGWQSNANMYGTPQQTRADIECESAGGQTKTITVYGTGTNAVIPAGTFTQSTGRIRIKVTSTAGGTATSDWINVNTPEVQLIVTPDISDGFFIPKNEPKTISWALAWNPDGIMPGSPAQLSATVSCKNGAETKTVTVSNAVPSAVIPAGTFTQDEGQIQITVNTAESSPASTAWINVNTVDQLGTAQIIKPRGEKINGDQENIFSWSYNNPTGTSQTKAELQISYNDGGGWQELAAVNSSIKYTTIPAGKITPGACSWRVRCFNSDGKPGEYSEPAYLIVQAKPKAPLYVVTDAKPLLTVSWASQNQQGYQLQIIQQDAVVYDSDIVFGVATEHRLPVLLENGSYQVQVRIIDTQGAWSDWKSTAADVRNIEGKKISVEVKSVWYGVRIAWDSEQSYMAYYILRDGKAVAKTTGKEWTDWETVGKHRYTVKGISEGYYTDSKSQIGVPTIRYAAICEKGKMDWQLLKYHEGAPFTHEESSTADIEYVYYAGRSRPVPYPLQQVTNAHSIEFTVKTQEQWQNIKALLGKKVIYKDYRGALVIGMLDDISASHTKRTTFSLQITETDEQEVILYES